MPCKTQRGQCLTRKPYSCQTLYRDNKNK
jgi:hypothetical protein